MLSPIESCMHAPDELSLFAARLEAIGVPYMITGATAAIFYGQPRVTNDLDVVVSLDDAGRSALLREFSEAEFYVPPESVIRAEQARTQRGHFNLIHLESGFKADVYLAGDDALHAWALPRRRRVQWTDWLFRLPSQSTSSCESSNTIVKEVLPSTVRTSVRFEISRRWTRQRWRLGWSDWD
jgi:hypothetical protein